ncbi:MAG TPA: peptidylprolyl isomerase, partial [Chloroflexota bacterium]
MFSELPFVRTILFLALAIILTGCGTTAAGSGQATATPVGQWSHSPPMTINPAHGYTAALTTSDGVIRVQLLPKIAPVTVNNFVFLARHRFYDGLLFHRIVKGFVVQTGDPTGTGLGGPGYHFKNEKVTLKYTPGTLAMANSGVNMNGSQ